MIIRYYHFFKGCLKMLPSQNVYSDCILQSTIYRGKLFNILNESSNEQLEIYLETSYTDPIKMEKVRYARTITYNKLSHSRFGSVYDVTNEYLSATTDDFAYKAIITKDDINNFYLTIYHNGVYVIGADMGKSGFNERIIHNKGVFGIFKWNPLSNAILYISEQKVVKNQVECNDVSAESNTYSYDQYKYQENFGEAMLDVKNPKLNVLRIISPLTSQSTVWKVDKCSLAVPEHIAPSSATWYPNDTNSKTWAIVFIGYYKEPYPKGIIFITTRRTCLCSITYDSQNVEKSQTFEVILNNGAYRCPAFSGCGQYLTYIEDRLGGPHHLSSRLSLMHWPTKQCHIIVDWSPMNLYYNMPHTITNITFYGIYNMEEFNEPYKFPGIITTSTPNNGKEYLTIFFSTNQGPHKTIMGVLCCKCNNEDCHLTTILPMKALNIILTPKNGCWTLLDYKHNYVLASYSNFSCPMQLMIAHINYTKLIQDVWLVESNNLRPPNQTTINYPLNWVSLTHGHPQQTVNNVFEQIEWEILTLNAESMDKPIYEDHLNNPKSLLMDSIVVRNKKNCTTVENGIIVMPHGGPHAVFNISWMPQVTALALLNYTLLLVNYVGSSGYGDAYIQALHGKIGILDVQNVHNTVRHYVKKEEKCKITEKTKVYAYGGSHGGYIVCMLAAQYPDFYEAICCRNPVIDIPLLWATSDIPEWCCVECGIDETFDNDQKSMIAGFKSMLAKSPITYAHKIKSPILFLLGDRDVRVPLSQSIRLYRKLKETKIPTKALIYPSGHRLEEPKVDYDCFMNMIEWFKNNKKY